MKTLSNLFTALLLLVATVASAHDFEVGGIYYNITNSTTKEVAVAYKGSSYNSYSNEYTGSVIIPESVTYNDVTYSVTSIGNFAFYGCYSLASIEIPNSVTSIGNSAFYDCSGLIGDLVIPDGVTTIGSSAFYNCSGLTGELVIPDGVTSIGNYAFYSCSGLTSLTIGNCVTSIGNYAFHSCSGLAGELVIPNSVTTIGSSAFYNCSGLTGELVIPDGVTTISSSAFRFCSGLTGLTIGAGVTTIGDYAFSDCSGLTGLTVGEGVATIGSNAFNSCSRLEGVYISNLSAWCNIDFGNNNSTPLYFAGNLYLNDELVTEINIPEGVESVKKYAFYNCSKLTNVTIPSSVTSIGGYAFNAVQAVFDIAAETPATLGGSSTFAGNAVFVVPSASVDAYKTAWNGYASQITGRDDAFVNVDVKAMDATSGIMERIGFDKMASIAKLTVKGSINSYDVIQFRDKMPLLRELDLSEATVVASDKDFYNGNSTKDNDFGNYAFYGLSKLNYVKLPNDLISVSPYAFYGCSSLRKLEIPETVQSVGKYAFYNCTSLTKVKMPQEIVSIGECAFDRCSSLEDIVISAGIKSLSAYTFSGCSRLKNVTLPNGLESIGREAFSGCSALNGVKLPPTIKTIAQSAFKGCLSLEEIRIPSSVESIGEGAFGSCSKLNKVYTYTVEPTAIKESTFSTFQTATLYVPSFSVSNYYWDDGWKRFLNLAEFNEPYEYFYVNNDYTLNDDTGYIEGTDGNAPDADINAGGGFIVEGEQGDDETPNQSLGDVNVGSDGNGNSGSIIGDNNLHIDDLHIKITVKGGRWYFFAFPFDIKFSDISMENGSDYVFRYYDGEERAKKGKGGWKDIDENHLKSARGYIFQCSANDVLVLNFKDVKFKKEDKYNELVAHVSENLKDASWNFVGNPYLSYYDLADMDYTAPVTVWDGSKYVAIRLSDDDYHFAPYEAFFVQKPDGKSAVGFDGKQQMTKNKSDKKKEKQNAARRARGINPERLLINLVLDNGTSNDLTRIVFNNQQSLAYETACDASKFETKGVAQLYTIGRDNVHYAINERPADNGVVMLGYTAPTAGFYTIEAQRMDAEVFVKDYKTGELHNLNDGAYSFSTDAGTFNERFEILLKGTAPGTTGIDEVNGENGEVKGDIYDLQGRKMKDAGKGIYIIGGEKILK